MDAASLRGMGVRRRDDDAASRRIAACRDQPCGSCSIPVTGSRGPGGISGRSRCHQPSRGFDQRPSSRSSLRTLIRVFARWAEWKCELLACHEAHVDVANGSTGDCLTFESAAEHAYGTSSRNLPCWRICICLVMRHGPTVLQYQPCVFQRNGKPAAVDNDDFIRWESEAFTVQLRFDADFRLVFSPKDNGIPNPERQ
jgi:hypothetical protein